MEDINDMKKMWSELNNRLNRLEEENLKLAQEIMLNKLKSSQEKLVSRYKTFIILGLIMAILFPLMILKNPLIENKYRLITTIYWFIFFVSEILLDYYLMFRIKEINVNNSTIKQISHQALQTWKIHKTGILIGLPVAFGALYLFALCFNANQYTIMGMLLGIIIGGLIGFRELRRFHAYYKILYSE